jgi:hypothetical protein
VSVTKSEELLARHGRGATGDDFGTAQSNLFISAQRVT